MCKGDVKEMKDRTHLYLKLLFFFFFFFEGGIIKSKAASGKKQHQNKVKEEEEQRYQEHKRCHHMYSSTYKERSVRLAQVHCHDLLPFLIQLSFFFFFSFLLCQKCSFVFCAYPLLSLL